MSQDVVGGGREALTFLFHGELGEGQLLLEGDGRLVRKGLHYRKGVCE